MKTSLIKYFLVTFLLITFLAGCTLAPLTSSKKTNEEEEKNLIVFAAGSLIIPFSELEKAFEAKYPDIDLQAQYHGSIQVIRHATELHEQIDIVATADASLIPMLMYEMDDPETGLPYADWYLRFASNHLAIAYRSNSLYAGEINQDNWYTILSRPEVRVGLADPRFDAAGYRALMIYSLARDFYSRPSMFVDMFGSQFTYPFGIFSDGELTTITVPQIIESTADSHILVRGASIQLIALLESGDLDYAFEYQSVIHQHDLQMVELPEAINLGGDDIDYGNVLVQMDFQRFASVKPVFLGEKIGYGITIPRNAPNPEEAILFLEFLFGDEGRSIMESNSHPVMDPLLANGYENIPHQLQSFSQPDSP